MSSCFWVRVDSASRMRDSTLPMVVSAATAVTFTSICPVMFVEPAYTSVPACASIGTASPVSDAWLMSLCPETMTPSAGRFSPGLTRMIIPIATPFSATICSLPSSISLAWPGVKSTRSRIARCAPHAVRLRMRFAIQRKSARNPAARYMPAARAATTASEARESLEG